MPGPSHPSGSFLPSLDAHTHTSHPPQAPTEADQRVMEKQLVEKCVHRNVQKVLDRLGFNAPELPGPNKVRGGASETKKKD